MHCVYDGRSTTDAAAAARLLMFSGDVRFLFLFFGASRADTIRTQTAVKTGQRPAQKKSTSLLLSLLRVCNIWAYCTRAWHDEFSYIMHDNIIMYIWSLFALYYGQWATTARQMSTGRNSRIYEYS